MAWMSRGSRPITRCLTSSTAATVGWVLKPPVASPMSLVTVVGVDDDVYPVLPRVADNDGSDIGDFHVCAKSRALAGFSAAWRPSMPEHRPCGPTWRSLFKCEHQSVFGD